MGEMYKIECKNCGYKQEVQLGIGFSGITAELYYCPECDRIFNKDDNDNTKNICQNCGAKLKKIPDNNKLNSNIHKIKCPVCKQRELMIELSGFWD